MPRSWLKTIFRKYKKELLWFFIADFMGEVPEDVEKVALVIAWEKRRHFKKWLQYQSLIALRMSKEQPQLQEMYMHWILLVNFQMNMLEKDNLIREEEKIDPDAPNVPVSTLEEDIARVQDFIGRKK